MGQEKVCLHRSDREGTRNVRALVELTFWGQTIAGTLMTAAARDSIVGKQSRWATDTARPRGAGRVPVEWEDEAGQSAQREKQPRGLPSSPSSPHPGPRPREASPGQWGPPLLSRFSELGRAGRRTLRWGGSPRRLRVPGHSTPGLLWPGAESGSPARTRPHHLPHQRPSSLRPSQTRAGPAGVTTPALRPPRGAPEARLCGPGPPSILPDRSPGVDGPCGARRTWHH